MKHLVIITSVLFTILTSCVKFDEGDEENTVESLLSAKGVFLLNEGNFNHGNGSLSFYSYNSFTLYNQLFYSVNQRPLGDIPMSMAINGNRIYIVVNNSGRIEIVDKSSLKSVSSVTGLVSPRYIEVVGTNKAYVTSLYSDSVAILNLSTGNISGYIDLKKPSEAITVSSSGKAFIAHWYGGNKIMVVNIESNQVIDSVEVGAEPESMAIDRYNTLWVLCNGGWDRKQNAELIAINVSDHKIVRRLVFPSITDSPLCLRIDGRGENLYYLKNGVMQFNVKSSELPLNPVIYENNHLFYKLAVNPENDEIFVTDVVDYIRKGYLLRYKNNGTPVSEIEADIIPGFMYFIN